MYGKEFEESAAEQRVFRDDVESNDCFLRIRL
jgi:hypothetical protein